MFAGEGSAQGCEVAIEEFGLVPFTGGFVEAGADEIGEVFHPTSTTDVLKIDCCDLVARFGKAEVRELGIAVDEGLVAGGGEDAVEGRGSVFQWEVIEGFEFFTAGGEVPVGACFPKASRFFAHEGGVEVSQPIEAGIELGGGD